MKDLRRKAFNVRSVTRCTSYQRNCLSGWTKQEITRYEGIRVMVQKKFKKVFCKCDPRPEGTLLNLQHILSCTRLRPYLGDIQAAHGHHPRSIVWDAERALEGPYWRIENIAKRLKAMTLNLAKSFYEPPSLSKKDSKSKKDLSLS